jgi:hypothetical protein
VALVGLVVSLVIIAVGAILTFAVNVDEGSVDPQVVGVILMVVGFVALILDLLLWSQWGPGYMRRRTVVDGGYPARRYPTRRRAVVQDEVVEEVAPRRRVVQDEIVEDGPPGPPPP